MAVDLQATGSGGPVLSVENIDVRFGGIHALKGVSLNVHMQARYAGLIGPNGAGKTTLFNSVTPAQSRSPPVLICLLRTGDRSRWPRRQIIRHGNSPHVPEPRHLRRHDGARKRHARRSPFEWSGRIVEAMLRPGRSRHHREQARPEQRCRAILDELNLSGRCRQGGRARCPTRPKSAWRSPERLPRVPPYSCSSTSRRAALPTARLPKFGDLVSRVRDDLWRHGHPDRASYGAGHEPLRPYRGFSPRSQLGERHARGGEGQSGGHRRLSREDTDERCLAGAGTICAGYGASRCSSQGIDLSVEQGTIVALLGSPTAPGKTTILQSTVRDFISGAR